MKNILLVITLLTSLLYAKSVSEIEKEYKKYEAYVNEMNNFKFGIDSNIYNPFMVKERKLNINEEKLKVKIQKQKVLKKQQQVKKIKKIEIPPLQVKIVALVGTIMNQKILLTNENSAVKTMKWLKIGDYINNYKLIRITPKFVEFINSDNKIQKISIENRNKLNLKVLK